MLITLRHARYNPIHICWETTPLVMQFKHVFPRSVLLVQAPAGLIVLFFVLACILNSVQTVNPLVNARLCGLCMCAFVFVYMYLCAGVCARVFVLICSRTRVSASLR